MNNTKNSDMAYFVMDEDAIANPNKARIMSRPLSMREAKKFCTDNMDPCVIVHRETNIAVLHYQLQADGRCKFMWLADAPE